MVYEQGKFQLVDPHDGTIRYFEALDVLQLVSLEFTSKAKYQGVLVSEGADQENATPFGCFWGNLRDASPTHAKTDERNY